MEMIAQDMQKIRVLIVGHMFPSRSRRQHGVFLCRVALQLAQYGVECAFLVARPWAPWPLYTFSRWRSFGPRNPLTGPPQLEKREVRYVRPPGRWFRRFEGGAMALALREAARRWHGTRPFNVVLGVPMLPGAEAAATISRDLGLPLATLAIGSDIMVYTDRMPLLRHRLGELLATDIDLPLGVSEAICQELAEMGPCKRTPVCVYLGRGSKDFSPPAAGEKENLRRSLGWSEDDVAGVYVGHISDSKGMAELAAAAEALLAKHHRFRLVCVGGGPAAYRFTGLRHRLDHSDRLVLPGEVAPEQVSMFLKASDFLIFPSHSEGLPQAVLEAMDCGLGVVATKVGGIPEAVVDGRTGILVEPKQSALLCAAIERMIRDTEFRTSSGLEGLRRARDKFDTDRNTRNFAAHLFSLAVGPPSGGRKGA